MASGRDVASAAATVSVWSTGGIGADCIGGITGADPVTGRFSSVRVEGTVYGEYRFTDIFGMNLTFRASSNITDVAVGLNRLDFTRYEAFAGLRLAW